MNPNLFISVLGTLTAICCVLYLRFRRHFEDFMKEVHEYEEWSRERKGLIYYINPQPHASSSQDRVYAQSISVPAPIATAKPTTASTKPFESKKARKARIHAERVDIGLAVRGLNRGIFSPLEEAAIRAHLYEFMCNIPKDAADRKLLKTIVAAIPYVPYSEIYLTDVVGKTFKNALTDGRITQDNYDVLSRCTGYWLARPFNNPHEINE